MSGRTISVPVTRHRSISIHIVIRSFWIHHFRHCVFVPIFNQTIRENLRTRSRSTVQIHIQTFQVEPTETFPPKLYATLSHHLFYQVFARFRRQCILRIPMTCQRIKSLSRFAWLPSTCISLRHDQHHLRQAHERNIPATFRRRIRYDKLIGHIISIRFTVTLRPDRSRKSIGIGRPRKPNSFTHIGITDLVV